MKILRSLFGLFLIFAILYGGYKIAPCYVANFQLESVMDDAARTGAMNPRVTDEELRGMVVGRSSRRGCP